MSTSAHQYFNMSLMLKQKVLFMTAHCTVYSKPRTEQNLVFITSVNLTLDFYSSLIMDLAKDLHSLIHDHKITVAVLPFHSLAERCSNEIFSSSHGSEF